MPKTLPVNLSNKYGNVFIDELVSTSTIDVKYGKLTANKILHDSKEPLTKIIFILFQWHHSGNQVDRAGY